MRCADAMCGCGCGSGSGGSGEGLASGGSGGLGYGVSAFSNLNVSEEWKGFLVSDTLLLEAELEYADHVAVQSHESGLGFEGPNSHGMLRTLGSDMSVLLETGLHSDVEIGTHSPAPSPSPSPQS
jgi:hypothetical protein